MQHIFILFCLAISVTSWVHGLKAETHTVSDLASLERILGQSARPGDVVELQPGTYYLDTDRIRVDCSGTAENPIVVRGVLEGSKRPVIDASRVNVRRSVFWVRPGAHDLLFENLEITGAVGSRFADQPSFGHNATAIYFDGCHNITVRNCISHHNEDGFFANHEADYILIDGCEISHNGTAYEGRHNRTHNFYFCAKHQIVKNCYIHHSTEGENFKSRGDNTIFAFNWVDEDAIYSIAVDSGGGLNTLWLGNVVLKRTELGHGQGRLLGIGDGTGRAVGTLVALNNTFVTTFPRDFYLFTEQRSSCDAVLINNVFFGPGQTFQRASGSGQVSGRANWIANDAGDIPDLLSQALRGDAPGFVDAAQFDFRPTPASVLVGAGVSGEEYMAAIRLVTNNARSGSDASPSPAWLAALEEIERPTPAYSPIRKAAGYQSREPAEQITIGAYSTVQP